MATYWQGALMGAALLIIAQAFAVVTMLTIAVRRAPLHPDPYVEGGSERAERYANGECS